jgi:hypothetical protein
LRHDVGRRRNAPLTRMYLSRYTDFHAKTSKEMLQIARKFTGKYVPLPATGVLYQH